MVSILTFYCDDPRSNPAHFHTFSVEYCLKRTKQSQKEAEVCPWVINKIMSVPVWAKMVYDNFPWDWIKRHIQVFSKAINTNDVFACCYLLNESQVLTFLDVVDWHEGMGGNRPIVHISRKVLTFVSVFHDDDDDVDDDDDTDLCGVWQVKVTTAMTTATTASTTLFIASMTKSATTIGRRLFLNYLGLGESALQVNDNS